jgi:Glycosyl transferase family 2
MPPIDITAIVNLHAEGELARSTFASIARAKSFAEGRALIVEALAVLDRPTGDTLRFIESYDGMEFRAMQVSYGDLGQARNIAVEHASGKWIAFIDGDDLWAENWLAAAHAAATNDARPIVWHPLGLLVFGEKTHLFIHVDTEDDDFDPVGLSMSNYWASQCFAARQVLATLPYPKSDLSQQLGYEDWGWNMKTLSQGIIHKCVPDTINACRARAGSLLKVTEAMKAMPESTSLFRHMILARAGAAPTNLKRR